jgi:hypothetical protein
MNIRHKSGGEPEIKFEAVEERALQNALPVIASLSVYSPDKEERDRLTEAQETIGVALSRYGRPAAE